jgi:hypothetical protein
MLEIMTVLETHASIDFETLMSEYAGRSFSRTLLVATFLGILEMTRTATIRLYQGLDTQGVPEGVIHLRRSIDPGDRIWAERIAEMA